MRQRIGEGMRMRMKDMGGGLNRWGGGVKRGRLISLLGAEQNDMLGSLLVSETFMNTTERRGEQCAMFKG